ncbi:MAG: ASCH domain-containing protein [Candidatus Anammoxibacter sp.]
MAAKTDKNVILLPIYPRYANAIIEGKKKVEFRKLNIPMNIGHVVIYSTFPEKKIVGFFSVPRITKATPKQLWNDFKQVGYVEKEFLIDYFSGYKYGLAIHVGKVARVRKPFSLEKIKKQNPPQSFLYLENDMWEMIKSRQA